MSPPYVPICSIYLPFQVNLYVPNSKPTNEILLCMLEQLMFQLGLPISSMLGGLFSRRADSAPHSRERAGNRDAQSHALCKLNQNNCKQNSPWDCCLLEALVVSSKPWIDACWWRGSINFTILFGSCL